MLRFGNNYIGQISNPAEILLFKKAKLTRTNKKDEKVDLVLAVAWMSARSKRSFSSRRFGSCGR